MSEGGPFTEFSQQSWLSRLGGAIVGVLIGLVLSLVAFPLLFWNEGRAVRNARTLEEGETAVVSVPAERVDPANEGRLVHVTGEATTSETLRDPEFRVSAASAIRLRRVVEMYQWREHKHTQTQHKPGGGTNTITTYTYDAGWSSTLIDSNRFHQRGGHKNPGSLPFPSASWQARRVPLGAYVLSNDQVGRLTGEEKLAVPRSWKPPGSRPRARPSAPPVYAVYVSVLAVATDASFPANVPWNILLVKRSKRPRSVAADPASALRRVSGGVLYRGKDPGHPALGDVRIRFWVLRPTTVSVLVRQTGASFTPYQTRAGGEIDRLEMGAHSAEQMFATAQRENATLTWVLRLVGFLLLAVGIFLILRPLAVVADVLPFLGGFVTLATGLFALAVALPLALVTIALGWVFYRPLVGVSLLAVGLLTLAGIAFAVSRLRLQERKT